MREEKRLVLDANILVRAVFGIRVRSLLETFEDSVSFYTPDVCVNDAHKYVSAISVSRQIDPSAGLLVLDHLVRIVGIVNRSVYENYARQAEERMRARDIADWPIAATALLLDCAIWTEDRDFFGSGFATWTTNNIGLYLRDT